MLFDRSENKKEAELAYRRELKQQMENRKSRILTKKGGQDPSPSNEGFSLIANIERQQNERKKKNEAYYEQLRSQIEEEKRVKNEKQAEKKRQQMEEERKIRQEQQRLQERYQEELRRQNKGKQGPSTEAKPEAAPDTQPQRKRKEFAQKEPTQRINTQQNGLDFSREKLHSLQQFQQSSNQFQFRMEPPPPPTNLYSNKVQNEAYNFAPRKVYRQNYYKQLLGQRKRLEEETNQISELNRLFNAERYRRKQESRGLEELKNLQKMLDDKNTEYMDLNFRKSKDYSAESGGQIPNKKQIRTSNLPQRLNKDEWRKLD